MPKEDKMGVRRVMTDYTEEYISKDRDFRFYYIRKTRGYGGYESLRFTFFGEAWITVERYIPSGKINKLSESFKREFASLRRRRKILEGLFPEARSLLEKALEELD